MFQFRKTQRLLKKSEYNFVFSKATKLSNPEFIVLYRENSIGIARIGLVISKKKIRKACDRNRVKRLLREGFRHAVLPSVDIIFLAKKDISDINNEVIYKNLNKLWPRLTKP